MEPKNKDIETRLEGREQWWESLQYHRAQPSTAAGCRRGVFKWLVTVSVVAFLLSIASLVCYMENVGHTETEKLCFNCANQNVQQLKNVDVYAKGVCCLKTADEDKLTLSLHDSIAGLNAQWVFSQNQPELFSSQHGKEMRIGAHKYLQINSNYAKEGKERPDFSRKSRTLNMALSNRRKEYSSGVKTTSAGIKIEHPGLYFIYFSILFLPDSTKPCKRFAKQTFFGDLVRLDRSAESEDRLLKIEHTCCPDCKEDKETSFSGGVFYLNEGDIIQVSVSTYDIVYIQKDSTYMGLTFIADATKINNVRK